MNTKAKGTKGERDLIKFFNEADWMAIRSAGSGSSRYPSPDILAGNAERRLAIECKVTKENKKYFSDEEIQQLTEFSQRFGAESWIGVKFPNEEWLFIMPEDLEKTGIYSAVSVELAKRRGITAEELINKTKDLNSPS